ncbi:4-amino-4-deoxy-L-arabinose transferase [Microlunatus sagamiharensis]|uniref:4-amino-4-deoxy-L-arabinose transferase n=1 Tax=Microlunatus sagamiharensis TaxID=546874 RepID=A0A1H2LRN2_9ACTN|nr:hypothetical protein [Microlunatus sagamiharensis]SDU83405.1 4-amino-4-deoxy-L-arabinose transferase [Microlunatus sagamiharensis]
MTQTLDHQTLSFPGDLDRLPTAEEPAQAPGPPRPETRRARLLALLRDRRTSLAWFSPLLVLSAVVQLVNMTGSPQRIDDEGTYVAQAYAIQELGSLTHYTYWYDHPPLGWIQIAGWTTLTGGFERYTSAVMAGREFMVVCSLASAALLWMLGRRLGMSRPAVAAAVAIFGLSPLAVQFHRTVFLDNVATPWLLAAFVLVLAPRRQLAAFAGAAVCFAVAVLSKETYALFLPFLAWQTWRSAYRGTRRYTVSVAGAIVVLLGLTYVLLSVLKGELVPGAGRVSLLSGIGFQLAGRTASGSLFDAASQARVTTGQWLQLDPVIAVAAPLAALLALRSRRWWPVAGAFLFLFVFMLRPGYLPIPYVIGMLPFAALLVPAAVEIWWRRAGGATSVALRRLVRAVVVLLSLVAVSFAAPLWAVQLRGLLLADLDQPMVQAEAWVSANVDRSYRVVVDDSMWVDLVRDGRPRDNVVWYYKVDTDPAVQALAPNGWRDYDYVVSTNSMRTFPDGSPTVAQALDNATEVASFGTGDKAVQVYRINRSGADATREQAARDQAGRVEAGTELATNPDLDLRSPAVRDLFTGGRVDARILITLPQAAVTGPLTVDDVPPAPGEESLPDLPRRQVLISAVDGRPLASDASETARLQAFWAGQPEPFRPLSTTPTSQGLLVTYATDGPTGLLAPA